MTITYRDEKGAPLTADELDENFRDIVEMAGNAYNNAVLIEQYKTQAETARDEAEAFALNNSSLVSTATSQSFNAGEQNQAQQNIGVEVGVDVQAYSAVLAATTASFTTADETKLDGIETGATADQTGAEIKALYEAQADTNAFTDAFLSKLTGIETGATADQTGAEIKALYEAEANTNAFTDALLSKLNGIETSATADQAWGEIGGTLSNQTDLQNALDLKAPLASPTFTGTPSAPTATAGTNTTQIATSAFVQAAITDLTADKAFRRGNILGSVSETSGVPTAALIETGSNANGSYVRLASGLLVCWHIFGISDSIFTSTLGSTGFYYAPTQTWTYPSSFASTPVFITTLRRSNDNISGFVSGRDHSSSSASFVPVISNNGVGSRDIQLLTIGTWF